MSLSYSDLKESRENSEQGLFDDGRFKNEWFANLVDFTEWAWKDVETEVEEHFEKLGKKDTRSLTYTDVALQNKYSTLESAFEEYKKSFK